MASATPEQLHGARVFISRPGYLTIPHPFNPVQLLGADWSIWRGPADGDGLTGPEEQDQRSLTLTEFDPAALRLENLLQQGETFITSEEKLRRHRAANHLCPDAAVGQALLEEPDQATLNRLYKEKGVTWLGCLGTTLRSPRGSRFSLSLVCSGGRWSWDYHRLSSERNAYDPSLVLASDPGPLATNDSQLPA